MLRVLKTAGPIVHASPSSSAAPACRRAPEGQEPHEERRPRVSTTVLGTKATAARVDLAVKHEHLHRLFLLDVNVALVPFELERPASLLVWGGTNVAASGNGRHVGGARWSRVMRRTDVLGFAVSLLLATQVEDEAILVDRHDLVALVVLRPTRQRVVGLALERGWVTPLADEVDRHSFVGSMRMAADHHDRRCAGEAGEGRHRHRYTFDDQVGPQGFRTPR